MKRVELSYLLRSLRQAAICLSFIFIILFAFNNAKAQPGTVYGDFGAGFGDYMLIDRGVVKATIIKAEKADSTNFFFRANTENWNPRWGRKAGESARRVVNTILKNSANYCASDCGEINDMRLFLAHGSYYTFIVGKNIDADNTMSILETTFQPASISSVAQSPAGNVGLNISVTVNVTMEKAVNSGERVFLRYSDDSWLSSSFIELNIDPLTFKGSAIIPGKTKNLTISYYVFTTNFAGTLNKDNCDFLSLKVNNNSNKNFEYKVEGPKVTISPDQELTVLNLNGRVLTLDLSYDTYKDNILDKNNFTLNNAPKGVTVQSVEYISDIKATLTLAYDGTLFTKDSTHFSVSVGGAELTGANVLKSNEITIKGTDPGPEVWLHLLTTVDFTYNLGDKNVLWINAEIGQQTWSSFQIGYGKKNNDTTGWKWFNAEWYENGEGSNKRVHTEINIADIKEIGDYYYAARVKAENPQPSWLWHYANDENWSPATILNAKYKIIIKPVAQIPTLTIAAKILTESSLDNSTVDLTLANETFKDNILDKANFILNNVPKGVTVKSVEYKTNTTAIVTLAFDGTNFDKDSTHFSVTILAGELTGGNLLKSNELIIKCDDPGPEVWLHLLTTVDFTYNLGEKNVLWINAEIGQQTWSSFQIGYGKKSNDTTGWKWFNAEWYENGEGSNKRVHTEINIADIKEIGDYYYAARVKAENPQPSWLWHYANDENWSPATILNAKYKIIIKPVAQISTLTIASKVLTESSLDNSTVDLTLANETFKDNILDKVNFILNNVPKGVTVKSVEYKTNTTAIVTLAFDGTNFDKDSTNFSVTLMGTELTATNPLTSNKLTIKAEGVTPALGPNILSGRFSKDWKDYILKERGVVRAITLKSDTTDPKAPYLFRNNTINYDDKWSGSNAPNVTRNINSYYDGGAYYCNICDWSLDLESPLKKGSYYTFIIGELAVANNNMTVLETNYEPALLTSVTHSPVGVLDINIPVIVTVELNKVKANGERIFVRYSNDNWLSSSVVEIKVFDSNNKGTATIPGMLKSDTVSYYAFSSNNEGDFSKLNVDYFTLSLNNNENKNYEYVVKEIAKPSLVISAPVQLEENKLDNSTVELTLANETFKDATLDKVNFILNKAPKGLSVKSVSYKTITTATLTLAFDGTNFEKDSTHFSVTVLGTELTAANPLTSNELIIKANMELQSGPFILSGRFSKDWKDYILNERGVVRAITIKSDTTDVKAPYLFRNNTINYDDKWSGSNAPNVTRDINVFYDGGAYYCNKCDWSRDLESSLTKGSYYTFIIGEFATANNNMSVLETNYQPVLLSSVTQAPEGIVPLNIPVVITVGLNKTKAKTERIFVRYSVDKWLTSSIVEINSFNEDNQGTATIPAMLLPDTVSYYAFSSNFAGDISKVNIDYFTLNLNNNNNKNYEYIVKGVVKPSLNITATNLTESKLDNNIVDLLLNNETFKDVTLDKSNFIMNKIPKGLTVKSVVYKTATTASLTLAFDGSNFDADSVHFSITIMAVELTGGNPLTSNELVIKAEITPALGPNILSGRFSKDWKDYILKERGVVRAITLKSDTTDPKAPYLFRNNIVNYDDKWSGSNAPNVTREVDTIYDGGAYYCNNCDWSKDLETALSKGNYYTFIIAELANENNTMSVLETKYEPAVINTVIKVPSANVGINQEAIVTLTLNKSLSQGERVFVRYSNDKWATSKLIEINQLSEQFQGSASIPGFAKPDTISYYAFTSNYFGDITKINVDYFTLSINNNNNSNYEYIVSDIVNFKIEGTLTYANKAQSKMKNILVYLKTDALVKLDSTYTDQNGSYIFNNVKNGKYIVDVHISITPNLSAIQPSDALYINRYFLKIYKFTDKIFEKAADVNKDGNITPIDALFINRFYLSMIKKFPSGTWYVEKDVFEVKDNNVLHNFRVIFFGDVNGSYSPAK